MDLNNDTKSKDIDLNSTSLSFFNKCLEMRHLNIFSSGIKQFRTIAVHTPQQ